MNTMKRKGLVYGAFLADALALGPHWIYNTKTIDEHYKPIEDFTDPTHTQFHPNKEAGDLTHYGDQAILLLETLQFDNSFDIMTFKKHWIETVRKEPFYMDQATKTSLALFEDHDFDGSLLEGSDSDELGGFIRSAPLFSLKNYQPDDFLAQTKLTHNNQNLLDIGLYIYTLLDYLLSDMTLENALKQAYAHSSPYVMDKVAAVNHMLEQASKENLSPQDVVKSFGQHCSSDSAFPSALYILSYHMEKGAPLNFMDMMRDNLYAGGDSASRGMFLGMVFGAYYGFDALDQTLIQKMHCHEKLDVFTIKI